MFYFLATNDYLFDGETFKVSELEQNLKYDKSKNYNNHKALDESLHQFCSEKMQAGIIFDFFF